MEDFINQRSQTSLKCKKHIYSLKLLLKLYIMHKFNGIICFEVEFNLDHAVTL